MEEHDADQWTTPFRQVNASDIDTARLNAVTTELPVRNPQRAVDRPRSFERPRVPYRRSPPRALRLAVVVLFVLSVLTLGALIAVEVRPAWFVALRNTPGASIPSTRTSAPGSTALAPSHGTSAAITSIQPNFGFAGSTVAIFGRDIMSANGAIVARFGSEVAPTRCPSEERCLVMVPHSPVGSRLVPVRLQVGSGTSNALMFRYR